MLRPHLRELARRRVSHNGLRFATGKPGLSGASWLACPQLSSPDSRDLQSTRPNAVDLNAGCFHRPGGAEPLLAFRERLL